MFPVISALGRRSMARLSDVSSDQYFGRRLARLSDVSSDQYFGRRSMARLSDVSSDQCFWPTINGKA